MVDASSQNKTKNIVVFGSNGGIGGDVVRRLSEVIANGEDYSVTLVNRKGNGYTQAQITELMEALPADIKGDVLANLKEGPKFDPNHLELLKDTLKNADMVVCAAGLPRPDPAPDRTDLIYPNAPVVKDVATAMARYAPANTPLLLGTNPLDNTVQIANETLRAEWIKSGRKEDLPEVKVFGMAGTLDEARLRIYAAKELNKALAEAGKGASSFKEAEETGKIYVRPQDVVGSIYGQHGNKMVVDLESVTVKGAPLAEFTKENQIGDVNSLKEAIKKATVDGGKAIINGLGRSTQVGAAGQIFRMIENYFSDTPAKINACVPSDFEKDGHGIVSYSRPIEIGNRSIALSDFQQISQTVKEGITASRGVIKNEHNFYDSCVKAEETIRDLLGVGNKEFSISIDPNEFRAAVGKSKISKQGEPVVATIKLPDIVGGVDVFIKSIETITKGAAKKVGDQIELTIKSNNKAPLDALADAIGIKVEEKAAEKAETRHQSFARKHGLKPKLPEIEENAGHTSFAEKYGLEPQIERKNKGEETGFSWNR